MNRTMKMNDTMAIDANGLSETIAAIISGVGGIFGGMKLGRSKQITELKEVVQVYVDAHNFTKAEAEDLRKGIEESRAHNEKCESDLKCVREELDVVKKVVLKHIGAA